MEPSYLRTVAAMVLAVLACGLGFWLGEAGRPPWHPLPIVAGIVGAIVVACSIPGRAIKRASVGVAMVVLYGLIFLGGLSSFNQAFAECVERGEEVRVVLKEFHRTQSTYPERLDQLPTAVPCRRISRRTILTYERTTSGYDLRFGDWLMEHTATESESFMAHK